jgi:hypothetical protein
VAIPECPNAKEDQQHYPEDEAADADSPPHDTSPLFDRLACVQPSANSRVTSLVTLRVVTVKRLRSGLLLHAVESRVVVRELVQVRERDLSGDDWVAARDVCCGIARTAMTQLRVPTDRGSAGGPIRSASGWEIVHSSHVPGGHGTIDENESERTAR